MLRCIHNKKTWSILTSCRREETTEGLPGHLRCQTVLNSGDLWRVDAVLQTCLSVWGLHHDQSVPVLFTSIRGIYSPCLSIKLQDISPPNLTHGTKKLPTWALQHVGVRTFTGGDTRIFQSFYEYEWILCREIRGQSEVMVLLTGAHCLYVGSSLFILQLLN